MRRESKYSGGYKKGYFVNKCFFGIYFTSTLLILMFGGCKAPYKKVISRFKNGVPYIIYEYPDKHDTSSFISTIYYPNGKIHERDTVENLKIVGNPTIFYVNGKIYQIDSISSPSNAFTESWDGVMTRFYENGKISEQFPMRKGEVFGLSKHFTEDGILIKEDFLRDTIKDGAYREYYKNGKVAFQATFKNDTAVGFQYFFDENGDTTKYFAVNRDGQTSLPYKRWLENGTVLHGDYTDSSYKNIVWIWIGKDGKTLKRKVQHSTGKEFVVPHE